MTDTEKTLDCDRLPFARPESRFLCHEIWLKSGSKIQTFSWRRVNSSLFCLLKAWPMRYDVLENRHIDHARVSKDATYISKIDWWSASVFMYECEIPNDLSSNLKSACFFNFDVNSKSVKKHRYRIFGWEPIQPMSIAILAVEGKSPMKSLLAVWYWCPIAQNRDFIWYLTRRTTHHPIRPKKSRRYGPDFSNRLTEDISRN
jgi:hypothetical protein